MFKQTPKIPVMYFSLVIRKVNMKMRYVLGLAACLSLSVLGHQALTAPPGAHEPGGHVDITQVAIDFDTEIIHDESIGDTVCTPDVTASLNASSSIYPPSACPLPAITS